MPLDNGRFALLAVLCGLAAQSLSPFGDAGVRAAAVHRQPKAAQASRFARHDIGKMADHDAGSLHHNQASFSFPWSRNAGPSKQSNERRSRKTSSIAISNEHGAKYTINHRRQASTPQWVSVPQRNGTAFNNTASASSSPDRVMAGTVAIVSRNSDPNKDRVLASLYLVNQTDGTYVLDASDRNATELYMRAIPTASSSDASASTGDTYPVELTIPLDNGLYCATYDQAPPNPEPLTAQRCMGDVGVRAGHMSQVFMYNSSSGDIQPTYFVAQSVDVGELGTPSSSLSPSSAPSASMGAANAGALASSDSAYPTASARASPASWNRREDSGSYTAQNVTLVFVPKRMTSNAAAAVQEVSTSTVTQTVIVYSSVTSLSASESANAADATASPSVVSSSAMAGATGLSVEVVGNGLFSAQLPFSSVGVVAAASGSGQATPSPTPSTSPSPSIDAAAVPASYSAASSASAAPSLSAAAVAGASLSSSDNSATASARSAFASAQAIFERNAAAVSPVSTEPYLWRFKAEGRL